MIQKQRCIDLIFLSTELTVNKIINKILFLLLLPGISSFGFDHDDGPAEVDYIPNSKKYTLKKEKEGVWYTAISFSKFGKVKFFSDDAKTVESHLLLESDQPSLVGDEVWCGFFDTCRNFKFRNGDMISVYSSDVETINRIFSVVRHRVATKSATESYFAHKHWGQRITKFLARNGYAKGEKNERAFALVNEILEKEKEFKDTHEVIYHARPQKFILFSDLKRLKSAQKNNRFSHNPFQFWQPIDLWRIEIRKIMSPIEWQEALNKGINDEIANLKSINFSLFGNIGRPGECTWISYFMGNYVARSANLPYSQIRLLEESADISNKILDLFHHYYANRSGDLLQIFIPHELVNELVFIADREKQTRDGGKSPIERHSKFPDAAKTLAAYRSDPEKVFTQDEFNSLQGRLFIHSPLLSDPESNIKVFQYNTITDSDRATYLEELENEFNL